MRHICLFLGVLGGFAATLSVASSGLTGCGHPPEVEHVELEPGNFSAIIPEGMVDILGFTSLRLFWEGPEAAVVLEYVSADDDESYRLEYTIVGEELDEHVSNQ